MTRQTSQPIDRLSLTATNRMVRELVRMWQDGTLDLNPPYQRGEAWTEDQQVALIRSFLMGVPIPALVMNERTWAFKHGGEEPLYAMIDGQQRIKAAARWFDGDLAVPASWFPAEDVLATVDTPDGAYVTYNDLCKPARSHFAFSSTIPVAEGRLGTDKASSERMEAEVYLLVNGAGTPQTDEDLANAADVAER